MEWRLDSILRVSPAPAGSWVSRPSSGVHHLEIELALSVRATGHPEPGVIPVKLTVEATQQITIPADYSTGPVTRREEVTMEQSFRGKPGTENEGLVMEGRSWDSAITQTRYVN